MAGHHPRVQWVMAVGVVVRGMTACLTIAAAAVVVTLPLVVVVLVAIAVVSPSPFFAPSCNISSLPSAPASFPSTFNTVLALHHSS